MFLSVVCLCVCVGKKDVKKKKGKETRCNATPCIIASTQVLLPFLSRGIFLDAVSVD
jgi:hypothetical protein